MKTAIPFSDFFSLIVVMLLSLAVHAQSKEEAKVDGYIVKAKETTDPAKKAEYYKKAADLIRSARLDKSQFVKIADSYLEEGDIKNAVLYYGFCDKADKQEGYKKVGNKMIETAFDDPKNEAKNVRKAIDYFTKGGATAEGYEVAGDAYYNRGKEYYMKAAEYYAMGKVNTKIDRIANEYIAGGDKGKAAEVYLKLNTEEGFKKAGDLYYESGDFYNAYTAYDKGGIADGIKKYADRLYQEGQTSDADALYNKVAEMYAEKKNSEALAGMAKMAEEKGNFEMAGNFYEKAGEANKAGKARAFAKLVAFDYEGAKIDFEALGDAEMLKAITSNKKYLDPLKEAADYFDEVKQNEPPVSYTEDTVTHKRTYNAADLESLNSYYNDLAGSIVDNCYIVSANIVKITHPAMKDALMKKFRQYGAIRNVLDANFGKKLQKTEVKAKDVML
ncbi:MAG TPA: hypothetical protein VNJ07_07475 [Chitinophagales bacterium]|nr:hypothetical protein [Chitinophagales bacterium]